jgi:hypothetical protein
MLDTVFVYFFLSLIDLDGLFTVQVFKLRMSPFGVKKVRL